VSLLPRTIAEVAATLAFAAIAGGCGGEEFASCGAAVCGEAGTAGRAGAGGAGASGGAGGVAGSDGASAGAAGDAGATDGGSAADATSGFPRARVLDAFERVDGELGLSWLGNTDGYRVKNRRLEYVTGPGFAVLWHEPFAEEQEVFATLAAIDETQPEINIVLKAQELSDCELFEVMYAPNERKLQFNYCTAGEWHQVDSLPIELKAGDQLGARARAGARLDVFVNGVLAKGVDISAFPYHAGGGRIGVNCQTTGSGAVLAWDDFGGG